MDNKSAKEPSRRRRSSRIVLRIPLLLNQATSSPETDWESVDTIMVSEHGGLVRARQNFPVGATLDIRVRNNDRSARARVVWRSPFGSAQGVELGFEIIDQEGFWQIKFPPDVR